MPTQTLPRMLVWISIVLALAAAMPSTALAAKGPVNQSQAWPGKPLKEVDPLMSDYEGTFTPLDGQAGAGSATVSTFKPGEYTAMLFAGRRKDTPKALVTMTGRVADGELTLSGSAGATKWTGKVSKGALTASARGAGGGTFALKAVILTSPTLCAKPPRGAVVLLPYTPGEKTTLEAWENKKWQLQPDGSMQAGGGANRTIRKFQDFQMHLEFCIPYLASRNAGQGRGNSGVYILDRYETQVLDSFGLPAVFNGCASLYRFKAPSVNMSLPPLSWQTYDITFRAARMGEDGKTVKENPRVTVVHNGVKVQDDLELPSPTGAAKGKGHQGKGPIQLQDHGNPVRFRNIWLVEKK